MSDGNPHWHHPADTRQTSFDGVWTAGLGRRSNRVCQYFHPASSGHRQLTWAASATPKPCTSFFGSRTAPARRARTSIRPCAMTPAEFLSPKPAPLPLRNELCGHVAAPAAEDPTRTPEGLGKATKLLKRRGDDGCLPFGPGRCSPNARPDDRWWVFDSRPVEVRGPQIPPARPARYFLSALRQLATPLGLVGPHRRTVNFHVPEHFARCTSLNEFGRQCRPARVRGRPGGCL